MSVAGALGKNRRGSMYRLEPDRFDDMASRAYTLREDDDRWRQVAKLLDEARKLVQKIEEGKKYE